MTIITFAVKNWKSISRQLCSTFDSDHEWTATPTKRYIVTDV